MHAQKALLAWIFAKKIPSVNLPFSKEESTCFPQFRIEKIMSKPIVAIIGRQNVGKSTLLNRLAGSDFHRGRPARDDPRPAFYRRDLERPQLHAGGYRRTGTGMINEIDRGVKEQITQAMSEADAIIFVVDVKDGIMPADAEMPTWCGG